MRLVLGASVFHRGRADGAACINVEATTVHWLCMFPKPVPG